MKKMLIKKLNVIFIFFAFIAAIVNISYVNAPIVLEGFSASRLHYFADDTLVTPTRNYSMYNSCYCLYATSDGDTIAVAPGEKVIIKKDVTYLSMTKCMDNWMARSSGIDLGSWTALDHDPKCPPKKMVVALKLSDFLKSKAIAAGALPIIPRKGHRNDGSSGYFLEMRRISKETDTLIRNELEQRSITFDPAVLLFKEREGKPKLRPFLTHSCRILFGKTDSLPEAYAISELNTLSLYSANWIIDDKRTDISHADLAIAYVFFDTLAHAFIRKIDGHAWALAQAYDRANVSSIEGQILDTQSLAISKKDSFSEREFWETYLRRCRLLNMPYAFSAFSGALTANAKHEDAVKLAEVGATLGTGLQMINDLKEVSPLSNGIHSDLKQGRLTAPVWLMLHGAQPAEIAYIIREQVSTCHKKALAIIDDVPNAKNPELLRKILRVLEENKIIKSFS